MKKVLVIMVLAILSVSMLAGCGAVETKTGIGTVISIASSKSATTDAAGQGQADVTMAAVTVDKDGKILNVKIDTAQVKIPFDATGTITADLEAALKTKVELGNDYGMKSKSGISKEWFEQIAALEDWMVGKTITEIKAIKLDAEGKTTETDLVSSVTIHVSDYIKAVEKAVANAD